MKLVSSKKYWNYLLLICFISLSLFACNNKSQQKHREISRDDILAQVGGHFITINDFQKAMNQQTPYFRSQFIFLIRKKAFLRDLIRFEVLILEAERRGMQHLWPIKLAKRRAMINLLIKRIVSKITPFHIKKNDVKQYYKLYQKMFPHQTFIQASASIVKLLLKKKRQKVYKLYIAKLRKQTSIRIDQKLLWKLEQKYKK